MTLLSNRYFHVLSFSSKRYNFVLEKLQLHLEICRTLFVFVVCSKSEMEILEAELRECASNLSLPLVEWEFISMDRVHVTPNHLVMMNSANAKERLCFSQTKNMFYVISGNGYSPRKRETDIKPCEVSVGIPGSECPSEHLGSCHGLEESFSCLQIVLMIYFQVRIDHMALALSKTFRSPMLHKLIYKGVTLVQLNKSYIDFCKSILIPPVGILEFSSMCKVLNDQPHLMRTKLFDLKDDDLDSMISKLVGVSLLLEQQIWIKEHSLCKI
ncbi:Uncharacterized protein TCM_025615 [Theobroma cacao]|uniref:Uncharacterized protein n=1 Tax=Theobroma cacao TaxID=3641 RepID=A0A061F024_THECC|nr:Uncharacterized protein TCM_025615 [Theobroma cacao]